MAPTRLSPSGAALWAQCPRRWWYRYVDRLPEPPPGEPAVLGTFVHQILEALLDEPPESRTEDRARVLARTTWEQFCRTEEWRSLELDDVAAVRFRQRAWSTVLAYFSCETPAEVDAVARELRVEAELGGVPFHGFIDLVEADATGASDVTGGPGAPGAVVVTDYKTGRPPSTGTPWAAAERSERLLQPLWYAAALAEMGTHRPARARLLYFSARDADDGNGFELRTDELGVAVDDEALGGAVSELRRRWDAISQALDVGEAESKPGPLCGWCPFVEHCDAGQGECRRRWDQRDRRTGNRRLRADAPAVLMLGLVEPAVSAS